MTTVLLILGALYLLSQSRAPAAAPVARAPATGSVTPTGGTRISIPGVGEYLNIPGGGVSVTIDPRLYGSLFPSQPPPAIAQPVAVPDYQAFDAISAPLDVFPSTGYAAYPV